MAVDQGILVEFALWARIVTLNFQIKARVYQNESVLIPSPKFKVVALVEG